MALNSARRQVIQRAAYLQQEIRAAEAVLALKNADLEQTRTNLGQVRQQFLTGDVTPSQLFSAIDSERQATEGALGAEMSLRRLRLDWDTLVNEGTAPPRQAGH